MLPDRWLRFAGSRKRLSPFAPRKRRKPPGTFAERKATQRSALFRRPLVAAILMALTPGIVHAQFLEKPTHTPSNAEPRPASSLQFHPSPPPSTDSGPLLPGTSAPELPPSASPRLDAPAPGLPGSAVPPLQNVPASQPVFPAPGRLLDGQPSPPQPGHCPECGALSDGGAWGGPASPPGVAAGWLGALLNPPARHRGVGHPLLTESWLYRPFSAGWFMGMVQGSPLIDDWLGEKQGYFGGYRFGWDTSYYWGAEMRFAFGTAELYDTQRAIAAQIAADDAAGLAADDPWRDRFNQRRDADFFYWDIDLLYYPWGDAQWRPYFLVGLGSAHFRFLDRLSHFYDKTVFALPIAMGVKYRCNPWLALRLELSDNMAFGGSSGFNVVHNVSLNAGMEVRFGGTRKAYWPWNPGRHYW